jgi:methyltransferase-like protein/SAM-dependent methyltransferase
VSDPAETTRETTVAAADVAAAGVTAADGAVSSKDAQTSSYDAVPYSVCAFPQTRPDRLAAIATLFGMDPAPPDRCRVLELGCASGGNLIPMGLSWPGSRFVGIDLSERQIRDGRRIAGELDLSNVDLKCLSILDASRELGMFDYILCHGVYSWVPPEVQDKILQICHDHLHPSGVAYVSYNTFPGWHARAAIREMLCYHTERFDDPGDRIREARGLLTFLVRSVGSHDAAFDSMIRQEMAVLAATPDSYLLHEHLEDYNEPLYFHQFVDRAAAKDLQYLGEAQIAVMLASRLGPEIETTLRHISPDLLQMEQYMDFLRNRMFRQTLLCHNSVALDHALRPEAAQRMWIASAAKPISDQPDLQSDAPEQFSTGESHHGTLTTRDPLMKAAMTHLSRIWPESIAYNDLLAAAAEGEAIASDHSRQLATRLLHCYTSGLVEFSLSPPRFVARVSDRPLASPYARRRAREGQKVVNMRLESIVLTEPARLVLQHLDGQHDRAALVALVQASVEEQTSNETPTQAEQVVDQLLSSFARGALLVG